VKVGANIVAGVQPEGVITSAGRMLSVPPDWPNPFGDGKSGCRILDVIQTSSERL
jgi:UDP-N-acetylglucosamine 2-epimerase (non-hydrolysing)